MQILLLGGTGAMGVSLKTILAERRDEVFITSRSPRKSERKNIHYIQGDAHNSAFLKEILKSRYDAIVDFMIYESDEFKKRSEQLLNASGHCMDAAYRCPKYCIAPDYYDLWRGCYISNRKVDWKSKGVKGSVSFNWE